MASSIFSYPVRCRPVTHRSHAFNYPCAPWTDVRPVSANQHAAASIVEPKACRLSVLGVHVGFWFLVWALGSPLLLIGGVISLLLVFFERTRKFGGVASALTVVIGLALTSLFGDAIDINRHRVPRASDLVSPDDLVVEARHNRSVTVAGIALGLLATVVAIRFARRRAPACA